MSSVQDASGTWWKRCMGCGEWVSYDELRYEDPSDEAPYGKDLGPCCAPDLPVAGTIMVELLNEEGS